ncbi:type III secretion system outer membrane ring subunit SctC [Burkholderia pyrrocinia]|uniref:type III secretion system outer membrane ring subunit SctC n=1 Tax=Burkholderia pyrrocinia TaxID=60550 RepID=UPI001FC81DE3|nr:type III secretion system outer membrane ring subunit SctC [Burkholderia pyrrocinia]
MERKTQSVVNRAAAGIASVAKLLVLAVVFVVTIAPFSSYGAEVRWREPKIHIAVQKKELKDVLRDFTASMGVSAAISNDVQGVVSGTFDMAPQRFLDTLASTFGFIWFYDGSVLTVTSASDVTRNVIQLHHTSPANLRATLDRMSVTDARFPVSSDEESRTLLVSGPSQYVKMVTDIAQRVDAGSERKGSSVVRMFALKNAWAADRQVEIDGKTVTVAGVASVLANLYGQSAIAGDGRGGAQPYGVQRQMGMPDIDGQAAPDVNFVPLPGGGPIQAGVTLPPLPPGTSVGTTVQPGILGLLGGNARQQLAPAGQALTPGYQPVPTSQGERLPVIQADPGTNSVLVRDTPQRIDQYASLVNQLDVRRELIEIEAHVIEIEETALRQMGVNWRARSKHVSAQTGGAPFGASSGNTLTAVVGDGGRYLMGRINFLQLENKARLDASPKVATLDNVEAIMDNRTRFFVRVSGHTSGQLYSVSTGISLRVLPMVVKENGRQHIKLVVNIDDGQITGKTVDSIPVINNSSIRTQAVIGTDESLLIAGYRIESRAEGESGVPGLSKIPVLGALFRQNENARRKMDRVFLLTPRIVEY